MLPAASIAATVRSSVPLANTLTLSITILVGVKAEPGVAVVVVLAVALCRRAAHGGFEAVVEDVLHPYAVVSFSTSVV